MHHSCRATVPAWLHRMVRSRLFVDPCAGSGKAERDSFFLPAKSIVEICESVRAKPIVNMPVYACVGHPDADTGIKVRP